eukprot:Awhi_evm1s12532
MVKGVCPEVVETSSFNLKALRSIHSNVLDSIKTDSSEEEGTTKKRKMDDRDEAVSNIPCNK